MDTLPTDNNTRKMDSNQMKSMISSFDDRTLIDMKKPDQRRNT